MLMEKVTRQNYAKFNFPFLPKCHVDNDRTKKINLSLFKLHLFINPSKVDLLF